MFCIVEQPKRPNFQWPKLSTSINPPSFIFARKINLAYTGSYLELPVVSDENKAHLVRGLPTVSSSALSQARIYCIETTVMDLCEV